MSETISIPDGWERIDEPGYHKLVRRDAVTVPNRPHGEPFHRDAVVIVTDELAGVVKGPGARQSWRTDTPETLGRRLAAVVGKWISEGGDPYGGSDLDARLDAVASDGAIQQSFAEVIPGAE
jgi:hypothetical protein